MPRGQYDRTLTKEQRAAQKAAAAPASAPVAKVAKPAKNEKVEKIEKVAAKRPYNRKNKAVEKLAEPRAGELGKAIGDEHGLIGSLYELERHTQIVHTLSTANVGSVATNGSLIQKAGKLLALHLDAATIRAEEALKAMLPKEEEVEPTKVAEVPAAAPVPAPPPQVRSFNPPPIAPPPATA